MSDFLSMAGKIKATAIKHRNFMDMSSALYDAVHFSEPGAVIIITGPSRVGKSKIAEVFMKAVNVGECETSAVHIRIRNSSDDYQFKPRDLAMEMLMKLDHPFYSEAAIDVKLGAKIFGNESLDTFNSSLVGAFVWKGVLYLILDEFQHIRYVGSPSKVQATLDSWKSLAEDAGLVLILVGAYPIIPMLSDTPHLIGRGETLEFMRYRTNDDDWAEWKGIVRIYGEVLRFKKDSECLVDWSESLHKTTFGCIGLLKQQILTALRIAKGKNRKSLTWADFQGAERRDFEMSAIRDEIAMGESFLGRNSDDI